MKHIIEGALLLDSQLSCVFAKVEYHGKDWIIVTPLFQDGKFSPDGQEWCDYQGGIGFEDAERAEVERRILPIMEQMPRANWRTQDDKH